MLLRVGKALMAGILLLVGLWLILHLVDRLFFMPELDTSLLTDDPCAAPCWQNIVPGVTAFEEAQSQLETSPFVRMETLSYHEAESGDAYDWFYWHARNMRHYNYLYVHEGKVKLILIHPDYTLTLGQVVDKFGPPKRVYISLELGGNFLVAHLEYPAQGLRFTAGWSVRDRTERRMVDSGIALLTEDRNVGRVYYFVPGPLEEVLQDPYLDVPDELEIYLERTQEWKGFGRIRWYQ